MQARHVRAIVTGAVFGILAASCILISQIMIDRVTAPLFAKGLDGGESGPACYIFLLSLLALAIIFVMTGAVTVAWCGRLISSADDAIKTAVVAGAAACVVSGIILTVPFFQQQIHNNGQIYALGTAYTIVSLVIIAAGGIIAEIIYLCIGSFCAFIGGDLYYLSRRKKERGS